MLLQSAETSGLSNRELAEKVGCTVAAVKMARSRLQKPLKQRSNDARLQWLEARVQAVETQVLEIRQLVTR